MTLSQLSLSMAYLTHPNIFDSGLDMESYCMLKLVYPTAYFSPTQLNRSDYLQPLILFNRPCKPVCDLPSRAPLSGNQIPPPVQHPATTSDVQTTALPYSHIPAWRRHSDLSV